MNATKLIRDERGQTMAEFAIVLPILVVLLFGIVQFGVLFNNYLTLTDAARAGARAAAVARESADPTGTATAAVRSSASDLNQTNLGVSVTPSSPWQPGSDVTVTATYPYSISLLGVVIAAGSLTTKTTERVE